MTGQLSQVAAAMLAGTPRPGVYRWTGPRLAERLGAHLPGWRTATLPGYRITGKAELLACCAGALAFPDWFGHNWDALTDCLTDLSWLPEPGHLLVWDRYGVLAAADPGSWTTAREIFTTSAARRARHGLPPLYVLLDGDGPAVEPTLGQPGPAG